MTDFINARERHRNATARTPPTHKYAIGARVFHRVGVRSERMSFRITRHLPDGGQGLQYRVRGDQDGQERVVIESSLERDA